MNEIEVGFNVEEDCSIDVNVSNVNLDSFGEILVGNHFKKDSKVVNFISSNRKDLIRIKKYIDEGYINKNTIGYEELLDVVSVYFNDDYNQTQVIDRLDDVLNIFNKNTLNELVTRKQNIENELITRLFSENASIKEENDDSKDAICNTKSTSSKESLREVGGTTSTDISIVPFDKFEFFLKRKGINYKGDDISLAHKIYDYSEQLKLRKKNKYIIDYSLLNTNHSLLQAFFKKTDVFNEIIKTVDRKVNVESLYDCFTHLLCLPTKKLEELLDSVPKKGYDINNVTFAYLKTGLEKHLSKEGRKISKTEDYLAKEYRTFRSVEEVEQAMINFGIGTMVGNISIAQAIYERQKYINVNSFMNICCLWQDFFDGKKDVTQEIIGLKRNDISDEALAGYVVNCFVKEESIIKNRKTYLREKDCTLASVTLSYLKYGNEQFLSYSNRNQEIELSNESLSNVDEKINNITRTLQDIEMDLQSFGINYKGDDISLAQKIYEINPNVETFEIDNNLCGLRRLFGESDVFNEIIKLKSGMPIVGELYDVLAKSLLCDSEKLDKISDRTVNSNFNVRQVPLALFSSLLD